MADFVIIKARTKYTGKVSEKAIHFCDENNLQTSELWTILYYNYVFNKTRLNPDMTIAQWKICGKGTANA